MLPLFRLLARGKVLRGTALDLFARQEDRRLERAMITRYEADMDRAIASLAPATRDAAVALARHPFSVRGFGPVKLASHAKAEPARLALLDRLAAPAPAMAAE
jgi:indolepyruvate ferredoxin oxidoreductase